MPNKWKNQNEPSEYEKALEEALHDEAFLDERDRLYSETKARMVGHNWRQRGNELVCSSCPVEHGWTIPPEKWPAKMVGIDRNGMPILESVDT